MPDIKELTDLMRSKSKQDVALVTSAYRFAKTAHSGQKRYSGEPYFVHVFETAKILAELGMGAKTVSAGLLHDSIEDAGSDPNVIREKFGDDVLFLVKGVTKLGKIRYQGVKRHVESLRKLFVATSQDIRVLIIKLSDRLHNMRTLEHVPEHKRKRIASETMEVYAPIAHRLGMGKLKGELEDLAFKFVHPKEYQKVRELSKDKYKESERELEKIYKKLQKLLAKEKIYNVDTDYRRKHLYSLWRKLKRKNMDIDRIYDISALRVIVQTVSDCYRVLGVIHGKWRPLPGRIKDYIAFPKPNGYKSIHTTIFTGDGGIAEIQIRSEAMHLEAEYGIASHVKYKEGEGDANRFDWFKQFLPSISIGNGAPDNVDPDKAVKDMIDAKDIPNWIEELVEAQMEVSAPHEFMENLKSDFFEDRIFVFTPKGDVIDLPEGSSPIDFAYQIHTDIGDHIAGAKVNGKLASLDTKLENGDIVEIQTKHSSKPKRKWLANTKTTLAKRNIRSALNQNKRS